MPDLADIVMPKLGLTMTEGLLAAWRVRPGDRIAAGDVIFVVETDKIATDIEAPGSGELREILVGAGETVAVGTPVARWTGGGAQPAAPAAPPAPRVVATPLARRLARQGGIGLATLRGSGPKGRIKAADVLRAQQAASPPAVPSPAAPDRIRLATARRLAQAKRDIPHFYLGRAAEISRLLQLREELAALPGAPRVTLTHAIVAATGRALLDEPALNRVWTEDGGRRLEAPDVGIAVDTQRGLFAPVLRDAGRLPLEAVAARLGDLVRRSRDGRLAQVELEGGAVTVSNVGMHGARFLVPIVNPGQSMILGVGATEELFRPDAQGRPALRREVTLVLAADHRVLDGAAAARLLARIVAHLERPIGLLRPAAGQGV